MSGPAIARELSLPRSTVGAILPRLSLGRLSALERKSVPIRYERQYPGELIHVDIKKLGRIQGGPHGEVDPQTFEVRTDGKLLMCPPAVKVPLTRRCILRRTT